MQGLFRIKNHRKVSIFYRKSDSKFTSRQTAGAESVIFI